MKRAAPRTLCRSLSTLGLDRVRNAATVLDQWLEAKRPIQLRDLLLPLLVQARHSHCLWTDSLGFWRDGETPLWLPRFHFQRTRMLKSRIQIGIFAGIHGDEPAGVLGLMDFLRELEEDPELGKDFEIWVYPVCNPGGCLDGTRHSRAGRDLNREFWKGSSQPEVRLLEREICARQFQGIISLHSDDTSPGFYGYARGDLLARDLLAPALDAAERVQARDRRNFIDGFKAFMGMVYDAWDGILSAPPDQKPQPFEIILESPALTPLADQRHAFCLALKALLAEYRTFIAYGGEL
jgi:protein MpaA